MRALLLFLVCFMAGRTAPAQTATDPNEGARLTHDSDLGRYDFSWWGQPGRTYFLQRSLDLAAWEYLPLIESGNDARLAWDFTSAESQLFLRLRSTDLPTSDPYTADFDGDKIGNWDELLHGTDPLAATDTDANGLPDDWEKFYFGQTGMDPNAESPGGGLTNLQHFQRGSNPNLPPPAPLQTTTALLPLTITASPATLGQSAATLLYPADDSQLLIKNGNFSAPALPIPRLWNTIAGSTGTTGWTAISGSLIELQQITVNTTAGAGQYCELDSHWPTALHLGPSDHGIQQTADLARGHYLLCFDYRGRKANARSFTVKARGAVSVPDVLLAATNTASTTAWQRASVSFEVAGGDPATAKFPITLLFDIADAPDSFGAYIDNVILLPIELNSDLNNDGKAGEGSASSLKTAGIEDTASAEAREKGTEYLFVNDQLSNGLWDKEDSASSRPASQNNDDDVTELKTICAATWGAIWFEYEGGDISKLAFYETKECTTEVGFNPPFALSESHKLPEKLYVRTKGDWTQQVEGKLIMKFGKADKSETWAADKLRFTVVNQFGDKKYFHAARDYIEEQNAPFHVRDRKHYPPQDSSVRVVTMREEGAKFYALDVRDARWFTAPPTMISTVVTAPLVSAHHVVMNGMLCGGSRLGIFDTVWGAIISGGARTPTPTDTSGLVTPGDWNNVGSVAQMGNTLGFLRGNFPKASDGFAEQTGELIVPPGGEDNGDENYIGKRVAEPGLKPLVFVAMGFGGKSRGLFLADAVASGVVDGPASEGAGAKKLYQMDGGESQGLALRRGGAASFHTERANSRHRAGIPQSINNYISFKCDVPRP